VLKPNVEHHEKLKSMKKQLLLPLLIILLISLACNNDNDDFKEISLENVSGFVQKGPYLNGTSVTIYELTNELVPTGKNFPSQISDNAGTFEIKNINLISQYVLLKADGFYFNEITNESSTAQLTLYALSDLTNKTDLNVNVLSTLEKGRAEYLISNGKSFAEAKKQAQTEIIGIFEMTKTDMTKSEELDISKTGDDNAILLAVSSVLQGNLAVAELSELIANIGSDIREDGILNDQVLGEKLVFNAHKLYPDQIRKNLEDRYKSLNVVVNIPDFEKYIGQFIENTGFKFNALPELTTNIEVKDIKTNSAICGGNVSKEGISSVIAKGICWSTDQNADVEDAKKDVGPGCDTFTCNITGLSENTTYYARTYATNSAGTAYGNEVSFKTKESGTGIVTDIDGNIYHTVQIGNQIWMVENLRTTRYRNGDQITNITEKTAWQSLTTGGYCWHNNDSKNKPVYGAMYNWFAVNDKRRLAPEGWHVPSNQEWTVLWNNLGGKNIAGGKLKETGTLHWINPNNGATNESGFCALPGGVRSDLGDFYDIGSYGYWWCTDETNNTDAWSVSAGHVLVEMQDWGGCNKKSAYSVRCIKD
jgi:uncharacterized protein (TIGR02145 family)